MCAGTALVKVLTDAGVSESVAGGIEYLLTCLGQDGQGPDDVAGMLLTWKDAEVVRALDGLTGHTLREWLRHDDRILGLIATLLSALAFDLVSTAEVWTPCGPEWDSAPPEVEDPIPDWSCQQAVLKVAREAQAQADLAREEASHGR